MSSLVLWCRQMWFELLLSVSKCDKKNVSRSQTNKQNPHARHLHTSRYMLIGNSTDLSKKFRWAQNTVTTNTHTLYCLYGTITLFATVLLGYLFVCIYWIFSSVLVDTAQMPIERQEQLTRKHWKERRNAEKNIVSCVCVFGMHDSNRSMEIRASDFSTAEMRHALVDNRGEVLFSMDPSDIEYCRHNGRLSAPQTTRLHLEWWPFSLSERTISVVVGLNSRMWIVRVEQKFHFI